MAPIQPVAQFPRRRRSGGDDIGRHRGAKQAAQTACQCLRAGKGQLLVALGIQNRIALRVPLDELVHHIGLERHAEVQHIAQRDVLRHRHFLVEDGRSGKLRQPSIQLPQHAQHVRRADIAEVGQAIGDGYGRIVSAEYAGLRCDNRSACNARHARHRHRQGERERGRCPRRVRRASDGYAARIEAGDQRGRRRRGIGQLGQAQPVDAIARGIVENGLKRRRQIECAGIGGSRQKAEIHRESVQGRVDAGAAAQIVHVQEYGRRRLELDAQHGIQIECGPHRHIDRGKLDPLQCGIRTQIHRPVGRARHIEIKIKSQFHAARRDLHRGCHRAVAARDRSLAVGRGIHGQTVQQCGQPVAGRFAAGCSRSGQIIGNIILEPLQHVRRIQHRAQ